MNIVVKQLFGAMPDPEQEFLPAALEVQQTPPAPLGRIFMWVIMLFFVLAVIWAIVGQMDIVAVAQGKVIPSDRAKIIQPLEPGIVKKILVKEGQLVKAGQALVALDHTLTNADQEQFKGQKKMFQLTKARLETLISVLDTQTKNEDIHRYFKQRLINSGFIQSTEKMPVDVFSHQQQLTQQWLSYISQQQSLIEQYKQYQADIRASDNRILQLKATIPLITERAESVEKMLGQNMAPRVQWLELEQERIEQVKELDIQRDNHSKLKSTLENVRQEQMTLKAQTQGQWLAELNEAASQLQSTNQELKKADQRNTLQTLTSPIDGRVQQLAVHTVGGVVTSAQELLRIIPQDNQLEVEAFVENKDIGFVEEGHVVEVKLEAFPFTKYGTLDGEIKTISYDAIQTEQQGLIYAAQVTLKQNTILVNGKEILIAPGMVATVEVKTGKRKIIEYILGPLLRYKNESARER